MKSRIFIILLILSMSQIINVESHTRHDPRSSSNRQEIHNNKFQTDFGDDVQHYLMEFGYLTKSSHETANLRSEEHLRDAIRALQRYGNIPETGRVDSKTRMLLKSPRCGVPDFNTRDFSSRNRRFKRFVIHDQRWKHTNLTWSLVNQTMSDLDAGQTRRILHEALEVWSKNSKLNFQEVLSTEADIQVLFAKNEHGDGFDFDGPGNILAHAFYPGTGKGGDAHFDTDENWLLDERGSERHGTSLRNVAVHEFGHSLGLGHSSVRGAIMFPWYHGYRGNDDLPDDDRLAIQSIYGSRDGDRQWGPNVDQRQYTMRTTTPTTTTTTTRRYYYPRKNPSDRRHNRINGNDKHPSRPKYRPSEAPVTSPSISSTTHRQRHRDRHPSSDVPETCRTSYDAVTIIRGELFIFKGKYMWRIGRDGLYPGYPHLIKSMWHELPNDLHHIDSVYENKRRQIVFFIGKKYYLFHSQHLLPDYPKPLTDLGLPETLKKIDAALVWSHNNRTYFYSGHEYWKFDEDEMQVELDYPRDMSMWRGIGHNIDSAFQFRDGKTYFFKGEGYWQFDDYRMRVSHEARKRSSVKWMGCSDSERRQNLDQNPKREEEFEDLDPNDDDEEDMYFEIEQSTYSHASSLVNFGNSNCTITIFVIIYFFSLMKNFDIKTQYL